MARCILKILFPIALWGFVYSSCFTLFAQSSSGIPAQLSTTYLQNESILDIVEGPKGFVWIATTKNLYRFDGQSMTPFLPGNFNDIEVYPDDRFMLLSNRNAIYVYYYETDQLELFDQLGISNILSTKYHQDAIWIGAGHLMRLDPKTSRLDTILINQRGYNNYSISSILVDQIEESIMWLGTSNGLVKYHIIDRDIQEFRFEMNDEFLTSRVNLIACLYQHTNRDLFIGTWHGGVIRFNPVSEQYTHFFIQKFFETPTDYRDHVYTIFSDIDRHVWLSSISGTMKLDGQNFEPLLHVSPNHKVTITDVGPRMIDQERRQWMGYFWGLQILNTSASAVLKSQSPLVDITRTWNIPKAIHENPVQQTVSFYFGSSDGVHVWNRSNNTWRKIEVDPALNLNALDVVDIISFQNKQWILTKLGLYAYQTSDRYISKVNWFPTPSTLMRHMVLDFQGRFWINSDDGTYRVDPDSKTLVHCSHDTKLNRFDFLNKKADEIYLDQLGQLWMALQDSIHIFNPHKSEVRAIPLSIKEDVDLGQVLSFQEMDTTMWIGTTEALVNTSLQSPGNMNLIRNSYSSNLIFDQQGDLWFTTRQNLHRYYLARDEDESYSVFDGLPEPGRYGYEHLGRLEDGTIIVVTREAMSQFDPVSFNKHLESKPIPYLVSLKADGKELFFDTSLVSLNEVILEPKQRALDITFSAIAFDQPQSVNYRYKLEGVDDQWRFTQAGQHEISYLNLSSGNYTFLLNARYTNNIWEEPLTMDIVCKQKFFENQWVWLALTLLFLGSILLYFRWRIRLEQKKQSQIQLMNELERKALTAQMNPHFIFNAMTSIQHLISNSEQELAQEYLNKFAKLLRGVFEASKQLQISLETDISIIDNYVSLEVLRFDDSFDYSIQVDPNLDNKKLYVPALIAQPTIENAIHHGLATKQNGGQLKINISEVNNHIQYTIEDNGIGRTASEKKQSPHHAKSSSGMHLTESRLKAGTQKFMPEYFVIEDLFENNKPVGTRVRFKVPKVTAPNH